MVILYNQKSENNCLQNIKKLYKGKRNDQKLSSNCIVSKLTFQNKKFLESIGLKVLT